MSEDPSDGGTADDGPSESTPDTAGEPPADESGTWFAADPPAEPTPDSADRDGDDTVDGDDPSHAAVFGAVSEETDRYAVEPGDPSLENALFVLLGVVFAIGVLYQAVAVFTA